MTISNASEVTVGLLAEATLGTLPSPATFVTTRLTSESLDAKRDNVVSQEIRADRNVSDVIQVGGSAGGSMSFELSYGTFDSIFESALFGAWAADILKNGVTCKSFHIQKKFELGATDQFWLHKGMVVDNLSLDMKAKQIVTGSCDFVGVASTLSQAITGTFSAASTESVMNAASHLTLTKVMVSPAPTIRSLSIKIANKLRLQDKCASLVAAGIGAGRCEVTGSFEAYFESNAIADLFLAGTAGGIKATIGGTTLKKYTIEIPTIKILTATNVAGGNDSDVMLNCTFQGIYTVADAATIKITRAVV